MQREKKQGSVILPIFSGSLVSFVLGTLVFLGLSFFVLRGGSANSLFLGGCLGGCVLIGGRVAIQKGSGSVFLTGVLTALVVCCVLILLRFILGNTWGMAPTFLSTLLLVLAGGGMAGLFRRRKRK